MNFNPRDLLKPNSKIFAKSQEWIFDCSLPSIILVSWFLGEETRSVYDAHLDLKFLVSFFKSLYSIPIFYNLFT